METKESIVRAAMGLFAERGLDGVSVREICRKASVNVAMVNYHFRSKERLYGECVKRLFTRCGGLAMLKLPETVTDAASWRAAIREWVRGFSEALHSKAGGAGILAGFFRREVIRPSSVFGTVGRQYVQPVRDCLDRLLAMAVRDAEERFKWVDAIWAQLSAYALVDRVWHPLFRPKGVTAAAWGERFADFVCERIFAELEYLPA